MQESHPILPVQGRPSLCLQRPQAEPQKGKKERGNRVLEKTQGSQNPGLILASHSVTVGHQSEVMGFVGEKRNLVFYC